MRGDHRSKAAGGVAVLNEMNIIIVGASSKRSRFSNRAVRAFHARGWTVFPVHPREAEVEGIPCYPTVAAVAGEADWMSLYVLSPAGLVAVEAAPAKGVRNVYVNPGAGSPELVARIRALGMNPIEACSIIAVGADPHDFDPE